MSTASTYRANSEWMQTYTGQKYYPGAPSFVDVRLLDIAQSLSSLCRFGGHCPFFYSVAEHSVLVSRVLPPDLALQGLMHDATEAYVVDVPRPLKRQLTEYERIETLNWHQIAEKYDLPLALDPLVKRADNEVLLAERDQLFPVQVEPWSVPGVPAPVKIRGWHPKKAKRKFIERFLELTCK